MKNPIEVLRNKEHELLEVKKEVDALRIAIRLLSDGEQHLANARPDRHDVMDFS
jgi:hypothetical protein